MTRAFSKVKVQGLGFRGVETRVSKADCRCSRVFCLGELLFLVLLRNLEDSEFLPVVQRSFSLQPRFAPTIR